MSELALSPMAAAVRSLYRMPGEIDEYFDAHILEMKKSGNSTISRSGAILEMAKVGFGIGYVALVVIIAAGQTMLGNPLAAAGTGLTPICLTNPVAMTCAALGAIYYGWNALHEDERDRLLKSLSEGLQIGIELIRSVIRFVIDRTRELLTAKNVEEIKDFVRSTAAMFGKKLGDVTHRFTDIASDTIESAKQRSYDAAHSSVEVASDVYLDAVVSAQKAALEIGEKLGEVASKIHRRKHH